MKAKKTQKEPPWRMDKENNKYVYWGILGLIGLAMIIVAIFDSEPEYIKKLEDRYVGVEFTDYEYNYFDQTYGPGVALYYSSQAWIYYYPKGDFTMMVSKKNNRIIDFEEGERKR